MTLRAQIELLTVPQEFTRLCNAVLIAQHGDDFLPIDDDRADRGNDGYLKSEQRMFAAHCFKRAQNQRIDAPIRAKMVGDLGKAIALKRAGVWPIQAWTFLANYPIPDEIAAEVVEIGREAGVDVAWRGPDYFANALAERPAVAENFPSLQVAEVSRKLARLEAEIVGTQPQTPSPYAAGIPRDETERAALLADRPPGWEHLLFASLIREGRDGLESKWRDHELRLPSRDRRYVEESEIASTLGRAFGRLGAAIEPMNRVFGGQAAAFGEPGEEGDPVRIEHFAKWIVGAYEDLLDWGPEVRAFDTPR